MESIRNGEQCPFCHCSNLRRYSVLTNNPTIGPKSVGVVECRPCLTAWQWPLGFTVSNAKEYYRQNYSSQEINTYYDPAARVLVGKLQLDFVQKYSKNRGSLLDVGAGDGNFVKIAISRGWKACGVDLSVASANVVQGTIDDISGQFDVITMWDVIEHVENPADTIRQASSKLNNHGVIIIETGNYLSADRILNEERWWAFHPDHRWFHAPAIIEKMLREAGFNCFDYAAQNLRPNAESAEEYLGPSRARFILKAAKRPHRIARLLRQFSDFQTSASRHSNLTNVGIFAVAARKL